MLTNTDTICMLTALLSGISGYCISRWFWLSKYAQTDHSGDYGTPSGAVFATCSGMIIGMILLNLFGPCLHWIPQKSLDIALIASMSVGAIGGVVALLSSVTDKK